MGDSNDIFKKNPAQLFEETGNNTGNLAFWFAVSSHIRNKIDYFTWHFDPQKIRSEYDIVVFVAANQLNPEWDLGLLAGRLEQCEKPLVVIGLGAQASGLGHNVSLKPGTQRLLSVFSERSKRIGMRGQFSAEVAVSYGAKNVVIIGCPSNFLNTDNGLGKLIERRLKSTERPYRLVLNLDLNGHLKPVILRCVEWLKQWDGIPITQTPLSTIYLSFAQSEKLSDAELQLFSKILFDRNYDEEIRLFFLTQFISFFDVRSWINFLRGCRLSLGTRIYWNMLAIQAGVPAFIIPHELRTQELAETTGIPIVEQKIIERTKSLPSLLQEIKFDGQEYDRLRRQLAVDYVSLLVGSWI